MIDGLVALPRVYEDVRRILAYREIYEWEDRAHDAMERLLRHPELAFRDERQAINWLVAVAARASIDERRHRTGTHHASRTPRRTFVTLSLDAETTGREGDGWTPRWLASPAPPLAHTAAVRQALTTFFDALPQLGPSERLALVGSVIEGRDDVSLAARGRLTPQSVRQLRANGRKRLRRLTGFDLDA